MAVRQALNPCNQPQQHEEELYRASTVIPGGLHIWMTGRTATGVSRSLTRIPCGYGRAAGGAALTGHPMREKNRAAHGWAALPPRRDAHLSALTSKQV